MPGLSLRRSIAVLWMPACLMTAATPVLAQQPSQEQISAIRSSCRSDFMSRCSGIQPGGADALACLRRNLAQLSPACHTAVSAVTPKEAPPSPAPAPVAAPAAPPPSAPAAAPPPAPAAAAPALPSAPPAPAKPRVASPAPAAAPAASAPPTADQQAAIRNNCRNDFMARCAGVQPGGADALACLKRNTAQLSPACRSAVNAVGPAAPARAAATAARAAPQPVPQAAPQPVPQAAPQSASLGPIPPLPPRVRLHILQACGVEQRTFCANVPAGGGRIVECLAANGASLSPGCRQAIVAATR